MIGKVTIGKSFRGCVHYVMEKDKAEFLHGHGVRSRNAELATHDFNEIRKQKPTIQNAVWHASISFAYDDKVDNQLMQKVATRYIDRIGLKGHQYIAVRHKDSKHQHLHIVANRIGIDGGVASDQWCKNRTARLCDHLEEELQLTVARNVKRKEIPKEKITGKHLTKLEIRQAIQEQIDAGITSLERLRKSLLKKEIETKIHRYRNQKIFGISFRKSNLAFKGSTIRQDFSYKGLQKQLDNNLKNQKGLSI